jgi:hypothetical protein
MSSDGSAATFGGIAGNGIFPMNDSERAVNIPIGVTTLYEVTTLYD